MFLIDDLIAAPFRGLLWIVEKVHDAAQEEMAGEADAITRELQQLYAELEAGRIGEAEFDARERELLDRLDAIQERDEGGKEEDGDEAEAADDDQT